MAWGISYFDNAVAAGAGNGVPAGLFIPRDTALPGITTPSELASANKERKVAYAVANQVFDVLNAQANKLGLTVSRPTPTGAAANLINQSFTLQTTFMVNHAASTVGMLPLPAGNAGLVSLSSIFPGCAFVAAEGAISEPGVVVPSSYVQSLGGSIPGTINDDARSWLSALYHSMVKDLDSSTALVAASRGSAVGSAPAANFTGTGAITGLVDADLPTRSFFSTTYSLTLQLQLNQSTQTFDLAA